MQPTLRTSRLHLRPAHATDLDALWSLWTDAEVRRYLWDDREITRAEAADALADAMHAAGDGLGIWMIQMRDAHELDAAAAGRPIGCAALLPVTVAAEFDPRLRGLIEPLIALTPGMWGSGYATEALTALLGHAARTLTQTRVAGVTDVPNTASDRLLLRVGFRVLGEVPGPRFDLRTYIWDADHQPTV